MAFTHNQPEYSVSEIAGHIKRVVEDTFGQVRVRGEVSKISVNASSGHAYLTMKDDKAVLDAVCWKGTFQKLAHKPEAGLEVIATGRLTTYPGSSKYQLVIESIEPAGIGALMAQLEKRKQQLAAEGLFDASRKKPLPYLPRVIGVITSPTGAVIRDILHRISDRFPSHVIVWPVAVQGQGAAEQVASAIAGFQNFSPKPDVLIVARGGGSIEDLWCFNEEIVVRAAAASTIPLISAVGHETDTTLIDYASDVRAPTPTAAAEMAVPVREELLLLVEEQGLRMREALHRKLQFSQERLVGVARGLPSLANLLGLASQRVDELATRMNIALPSVLERAGQRVKLLSAKLTPSHIVQQLTQQSHRVQLVMARLTPLMERKLEQAAQRVELMASQLQHLDVHQVLKRGFAIVKQAGAIVTQSAQLVNGDAIVQFVDGETKVVVGSKKQKDLFD
ncbi:MAG: exodeoxyribonuclease VII large subunit [Rickettsiales bacterium]